MAFKPDREKLNAKFEGYKLSKDPLSCVSKPLPCGVKVARLKEEQFSFQHVRSFTLHNHLVLDPWDQTSAYWYADDRSVLRATFEVTSGSLVITSVYRCEPHPHKPSGDYVVNASIVFITDALCLFSDGDGSLQLLLTKDRAGSSRSGAPWKLLENVTLTGLEGAPFMILAARVSAVDGHQLNIATLELKDPSTFQRPAKDTQPTVAIYRWHSLQFSTKLLETTPQLETEDGSATENLLTQSNLRCTLQSHAISLYCDFVQSKLLVVNEAPLVHLNSDGDPVPSAEELVLSDSNEAATMESDEAEKPHLGLGYTETKAERQYNWTQSDTDVTITVTLPSDATKQEVDCIIGRDEVVVGLTDGTTYVRGRLCATVDPDASAWTIEKGGLEVHLEKKEPGHTWPSLLEGEEEGGETQQLPLRAGLSSEGLSKEELQEIERKIAEVSGTGNEHDEDGAPRSKKPRPMAEHTLEECDSTEEYATLFVVSEDGTVTQRAGLGGRHILFSAPSSLQSPDFLCLRHDVDAIVWQPSSTAGTDEPSSVKWIHRETFNALGYIQSAKEDKKFTTCPSNFGFAAISDCNRHVFVYRQPSEGVKGNTAVQYVHTIPSEAGILGLQATDAGLTFVLCENELLVLVVKEE